MMEMPKPTKEHEKLHAFAGEWEGEETMPPSPWGPGGTSQGKSRTRVDMDGFFVITDYTQEKDGQVTFRGHGVHGYDAKEGAYTWYWVDSMGMPPQPIRGKWSGDTLTFEGSHPGGKGRYTYRWEGDSKYDFRIENSFDAGATWQTVMEGTYRRVR